MIAHEAAPSEQLREPRLSPVHYDSGGLVWGYKLADATPIRLAQARDGSPQQPIWLHLNLSDARARKWLTQEANLPDAALSILLEQPPRVRLHTARDYTVGVVEDLHHDFRGDPEGFGELRFFIAPTHVISVRRHPLRTVDRLHRELEQGDGIESTSVWLARLVEGLTRSFAEAVHDLVEQVDELEDEIVIGTDKEQRARLAAIRRLLVRFRRHVNADRTALTRLRSDTNVAHGTSSLRQSLEQLDGVAADLDLIHERVRLLQDEVAGLLAEATNRNLYVLSIVTTALLPATLLTGFWGMNVGGLPWADSAHGVLWTGLTVVGSIVLSLLLLRGSRVL